VKMKDGTRDPQTQRLEALTRHEPSPRSRAQSMVVSGSVVGLHQLVPNRRSAVGLDP
jgi:hypothetical protein